VDAVRSAVLAIDRNLATAHGWIRMGKFYIGRDEETERHIQEALRISPRDAYACAWMVFAAFAANSDAIRPGIPI